MNNQLPAKQSHLLQQEAFLKLNCYGDREMDNTMLHIQVAGFIQFMGVQHIREITSSCTHLLCLNKVTSIADVATQAQRS